MKEFDMDAATVTFPDGETLGQFLESLREMRKMQEKTSQQMKETSRKMGLLNNSIRKKNF